jgi:hypothetical protein
LGDDTDTIKKNKETLIYTNMEVGIEVNSKKTKYTTYVAVSSPECRSKSWHKYS